MIIPNSVKHKCQVLLAACALLLAALPGHGQPPPARQGEIQVVARISKQFIEDVAAREEVVASIPYCNEKVLGFRCQGVIDGRGKLSVEMKSIQGEATFVVTSHGTASTYARGVRGPIVAMGPAWGPFTSQTLVRYDGRKFQRVQTTPWAEVYGDLGRVEGRRGGPVGRAAGRLALPIGRHLVPRAEAEATPIAERIVENFVDQLAEQIVARLDRTNPVEKTLNRVFPETRDWVFHMSSDPVFIQAAFGPRNATVPVLPENPAHLKDVRLELWLHSTATEAQDLLKLSRQPLAKALLHKYIETVFPELAALSENRSFDAVGPWLVISIGAPKAGKLDVDPQRNSNVP
jgi:hypothetical protein